MSGRTLALLYPGCVSFEIALALELLDETRPLDAAAPAGVERITSAGLVVEPSLSFEEVRVEDYDVVLVPGGDPGSIMEDPAVDAVLVEADRRGILIGAICGGVLVLAKAGIVEGRRITHTYTLEFGSPEIVDATKSFFSGTEYAGGPLVEDGNVITAMPDAYVEFAVKVAVRAGAVDQDRGARLADYYRGRPS